MAEQITEKGSNSHMFKRKSSKWEKKATNKAIRSLPKSLGKWVVKKMVIRGWID